MRMGCGHFYWYCAAYGIWSFIQTDSQFQQLLFQTFDQTTPPAPTPARARACARAHARASGPPPGPLAGHDPWPIPGPAAGAPRPEFPLVRELNFGANLAVLGLRLGIQSGMISCIARLLTCDFNFG